MTKLTENVLIKIGFRGEGKDFLGKPAYRFRPPSNIHYGYYHYEIQIVLGQYDNTNPNSGILSLYSPEIKNVHCITSDAEKMDYIYPSGNVGIKYINIDEQCIPIASHVNTLERLNEIYCGLTGNEPFKI